MKNDLFSLLFVCFAWRRANQWRWSDEQTEMKVQSYLFGWTMLQTQLKDLGYLNGLQILEYLHEMCFTCYDFSFKKVLNVV